MWQDTVCNFIAIFGVMRKSGLSLALFLHNKLHSLRLSKKLPTAGCYSPVRFSNNMEIPKPLDFRGPLLSSIKFC
jgi:hypothetical protein